ncbi:TPA: DUF551 domain-containing protein [Klebsiella pneumoniae]
MSILTKEGIQKILNDDWLLMDDCEGLENCTVIKELARMALAAMDSSESVELPLDYLQGHKDGLEWAAQLAEANHPETGDWLYDDPIELSKAIRKGPDMPPVQPVADSEPVAWLLSGGGAKNVVCFDSGNAYADPLREVTPLYRHAQPVPVVPEEKPIPNTLSMYAVDAVAAIAEVKGWNACRAAMLHAGNSPAQSDCCPAQNHVSPEQNGDTPAQSQGWIQVSERMPEMGEKQRYVLAADFKNNYWPNIPNTQVGVYGDWFDDGNPTWDDGDGEDLHLKEVTHWMPLPAGPQGVKGE